MGSFVLIDDFFQCIILQEAGCREQDAGCRGQVAGSRMQVAGNR